MSSTKSQVALATNIPNIPSSQSQKDYSTEESLGRQNSFGNNRRGNMKGKHLTRSHAMRESTSPPRTPTPRSDHASSVSSSSNGQNSNYQNHYQQHLDANDNINNNNNNNNNNSKMHVQSGNGRGNSPLSDAPVVIVASQHKQQQQQQHQNVAAVLNSEDEFPKLSPPKSNKSNSINTSNSNNSSNNTNGSNNGCGNGGSSTGTSSIGGNSISGNAINTHHQQQNRNNTNGTDGSTNTNTANNNNGYKKIINDMKSNGNDTHKSNINNHNYSHANSSNNNSNNGSCSTNNHKQNTQQSSHAANSNNSYNQNLNLTSGSVGDNQQQQQHLTSPTPTPIYNSAMNYQLNESLAPQQQHYQNSNDKDNRCPRNESQNSNISTSCEEDSSQHQNYERSIMSSSSGGGGSGGILGGGSNNNSNNNKKNRTTSNSKGNKPRLKNIGGNSSGSLDGGGGNSNSGGGGGGGCTGTSSSNNTSGFISRVFNNSENSGDPYTDFGGTDLLSFFKDTLNRTSKDRLFLLKTEKELIDLVQDKSRCQFRFPAYTSYNRMLLHRAAAYFGMEHNLDTETQLCVIVNVTKNTRIPDVRFKSLLRDPREESRKSILKRDTHSFDEARQSSYLCPDRGMLDRKAKSFEEREEDYERARSRIFNRSQNDCNDVGEETYLSWNNSMEQTQQSAQQNVPQNRNNRSNGKMSKSQNSNDSRDSRTSNSQKNHNYSGYNGPSSAASNNSSGGGGQQLLRGDSSNSNKNNSGRSFQKQDSINGNNTQWRLSPSTHVGGGGGGGGGNANGGGGVVVQSTGGYKNRTQSVHSVDSIAPSTTGYGNCDALSPEPSTAMSSEALENSVSTLAPPFGLVWAVTDISNVPKGSILINPHTLQPIVNQDGTIYHFDPTNLPANQNIGDFQQVQTINNYSPNHQHNSNTTPPKGKPARIVQNKHVQQTNENGNMTVSINANVGVGGNGSGVALKATSSVGTITDEDMMSHQIVNMDAHHDTIPATNNLNCVDGGEQSLIDDKTYIEENGGGDNASKVTNAEECDKEPATNCLSITTTTSTKHYDRIEVQKFKNQATSPNIPNEKDEVPNRENSTPSEGTEQHPEQTLSRNQPPNNPTPLSASSTPFSSSESTKNNTSNSDEQKTGNWSYTTSYQAPDGSTVFHTTTNPNSNPFCTTLPYQQAPDGSIYAVPPGMVYAYPQPVEGEVQGFFMPVLDPNGQRTDAPSLIPAGAHAIYPATGAATAMMPIPYPTAQFASATSTPMYPASQVIYSTEQFTPGGATIATAATPTNGQLQQIPMTAYPISYSYPYNGYWSQNVAYYVSQQAIGNAVTATPIISGPPQSAPPQVASGGNIGTGGAHVAGGVGIANIAPTSAAAGPPTSNHMSMSGNGSGNTIVTAAGGGGTNNASHSGYQTSSGTTYYGTGRIKRPSGGPHFSSVQQSAHPQLVAAIPGNNGAATTYQLAHAVPALALAAPSNVVTGSNDLGISTGSPAATTMYALPQPTTLYPANVYPYAPAGTSVGSHSSAPQAHTPGSSTAAGSTPAHSTSGGHSSHQSNALISSTPYYGHPPPLHGQTSGSTVHAPGPSAIPIVDPATVATPQTNSSANSYSAHSASSTPHSVPNIVMQCRNSALFSTPPLLASGGNSCGYSNSSTPHYYSNSSNNDHQGSNINSNSGNRNSPQGITYISSYEKRNNSSKKSYGNSNSRQGLGNSGYMSGSGKPPLLSSIDTSRASPSNNNSYHHNTRNHGIGKRGGHEKQHQAPLLSAPPASLYTGNGIPAGMSSYHSHHNSESGPNTLSNKPTSRLNAGAATFRQKSTSAATGRVSSQRNSPATNSSNENSSNNSPNSMAGTSSNSAATTPNTPMSAQYLNSAAIAYIPNSSAADQSQGPSLAHQTQGHPQITSTSVFIPRGGSYIPQTNQHNSNVIATTGATAIAGTNATVATAGGHPSGATAVVGGTVAAATLGPYNTAAAPGVYIKYGQTYFAHPSVALPNSRRSPSTDIRPPIAQIPGMYPAVNMMITAPPRHAQGRHPNPNYRGTRPPR